MLQLYDVSVFLTLLKFSTGLAFIQIDNLNDLNVISKLFTTESTDENIELINRGHKPNVFDKRHSVLIKRRIPHGLDPADHSFNGLYKPLVRVHVPSPLRGNSGTDRQPPVQQFQSKYDLSTETTEYISNDKNYDVWKESPKDYHRIWNGHYLIYLTNRKKEERPKETLKRPKALQNLAMRMSRQSGEDPLAPGTRAGADSDGEDKKWMPHYSPWNYWTYRKPLHQDACPGSQVRVAHMCMWIPPH